LPSSIGVSGLPGLGALRIDLAINVQKVSEAEAANTDVQVTLPKDLIKAAKLAAGGDAGLTLDAPGLVSGRLTLDLDTPRKGEADVVVTSDLIPKLPLQKTKGLGRFGFELGDGNAPSEWFVTRNLGNGVQFYSNPTTGASQFNVPKGF
jgi:hypothetical protein